MHLAALAPELEDRAGAGHVHVLLAQGGEAEAAVGGGVFVVADADQGGLQKPHHRRQHLLPRQAVPLQVRVDGGAQPGQGAAEGGHAVVLALVAVRPPLGVIDVLLAALLVAAGRLDVAAGVGADPDLCPRRRNHQAGHAVERLRIGELAPVGADEAEALAGAPAPAPDAGVRVMDIVKPGGLGLFRTHGCDVGSHAQRPVLSGSRCEPAQQRSRPSGVPDAADLSPRSGSCGRRAGWRG